MRLEYSEEEERKLRITEIEAILLNHEDDYDTDEILALENELESLNSLENQE